MFREGSIVAHSYFWTAAIVFLILFMGYIFWFDHKEGIDESDLWVPLLEKKGLTPKQIRKLSHDDSTWYYKRLSTCVGFGSPNEHCNKSENYCVGGDTFGSYEKQAEEVIVALSNNGIHPHCPLIYIGTD